MADSESTTPAPAGNNKKAAMIFIAGGILVGAAIGGFVGGPLLAKQFAAPTAATAPAAPGGHGATPAPDAHKPGEPKILETFDNVILNPAGTNGQQFLMVALGLELTTAAAQTDIKAREAEVRDAVIRVLGAKTVQQLTDITTRDSITAEVRSALETRFGQGVIRAVYFPQFVIQGS